MIRTLTILLFIVLTLSVKSQTPTARCPTPVKLNLLDSAIYYNLTSYVFPLSLLVDGNTTTMPVPTSGEKYSDYYHPTKGWRWDFDLLQPHYITDVKIYWGSSAADTLNIWMDDSVFLGGPVAFSRLRNINSTVWDIQAFSPGFTGWVSFSVDDSTSKIRLQLKNATFNGNPFPSNGLKELEVWGCRVSDPVSVFTGKRKPQPIETKDGTNIPGEIRPIAPNFRNMRWVRTYPQRAYVDDENVAYPTNRYNYLHFGGNPYAYNDSVKNKMNTFFWPAWLGCSQYLQSTGGKAMEHISLDGPNDDPEDPASYEQAADFAWHIGHLWGNNPNAHLDTGYSKVYNYAALTGGRKPYANNTISGYEPDNERNGWWKWYGKKLGPIADVAKSSAEKDGDQGRLVDRLGGNRMGVKNGDPNLVYIMDGTAGFDIETIKARLYLSRMLRGEVMWDIIQAHEYFSLYDGAGSLTTNGQIGNRGTYPEDDSAKIVYDNLVYWTNRITGDTSKLVITGEHGKDVAQSYPKNSAQVTANYTQFGATFYVDGVPLDSLQSQALDIERDKAEIWASGLAAGVQYLMNDLEVATAAGYIAAYVSSGYLTHGLAKKPSFYRKQSQIELLRGYVYDTTLSYVNGGLIHYRGHKIGYPDSIVNYIVLADDTTGPGLPVSINVSTATAYTLRQASFTSEMYTASAGSPSGSVINTTATIIPKYFFTYEPAGDPNQAPTASAGSDQSIELPTREVVLTGSGSNDPDGTISTYLWEKISGPPSYDIVYPDHQNTLVTNLTPGVYVFRLTVTDNDGAVDTDTVTITVRPRRSIRINKKLKVTL